MRSLIVGLLTFVISCSCVAEQVAPKPIDSCSMELPYGVPSSSKERTVKLCRSAYAVEYDLQAKIPVWVAYVLTPAEAVGCYERTNAFAPDYSLPLDSRSTLKDYKRSGYDTGHMANDSDMRWDQHAEEESFLLSNMTPQLPGFNRGIWKRLEDSTRGWALSRQHPLMIYAGTVYQPDSKTIGNGVTVPDAYVKVIVDTVTLEAQVYMFKHEATTAPLTDFLGTLEAAQAQLGIKLPLPTGVTLSDKGWRRDIKTNRRAKAAACALK